MADVIPARPVGKIYTASTSKTSIKLQSGNDYKAVSMTLGLFRCAVRDTIYKWQRFETMVNVQGLIFVSW